MRPYPLTIKETIMLKKTLIALVTLVGVGGLSKLILKYKFES